METKRLCVGASFIIVIATFLLTFWCIQARLSPNHPHIIIIIADDVVRRWFSKQISATLDTMNFQGRNDVGIFGSNQIPTPNIDALAYNGIILDRFYTQSVCTPSRTALLTGNYPIRSGMQGSPIKMGEDRQLPLNMSTMPEIFKKLGYCTHLVGKWHLGASHRSDTPLGRGFLTHFGYWWGFVGYFDYVTVREMPNNSYMSGLDFFDQFEPFWSAQGHYATTLFTKKALEIIDGHNIEEPLFLVVSHLAAHTGKDGVELGVPDVNATNMKFSHIPDEKRRLYAGVIDNLDDSVGQIMAKLGSRKMLENSIILFMSDNGAPTVGIYENAGSNWPLRGIKATEFEGGIRGIATIFSPLFEKLGYVNRQLFHITDWLPTLYSAAGGNIADLGKIDGINQWETLSGNQRTNRSEILVNIDEVLDNSALISNTSNSLMKIVKNREYNEYYGDSGRIIRSNYNYTAVMATATNLQIAQVTKLILTPAKMRKLRSQVDLQSCRDANVNLDVNCTDFCLFDLEADPCETRNIAQDMSNITIALVTKLESFYKDLVPQRNKMPDPAADPKFYNNSWCTWLDDEFCPKTTPSSV